MHYQTEVHVDDTTTHTNVTQSQYLKNFDFNINGYLHEQTWAKSNIKKFHKSMEFTIWQCTVCEETSYLNTQPKNASKYLCLRYSRDKHFPRKFSKENNDSCKGAISITGIDSDRGNVNCASIAYNENLYKTRRSKSLFRTLH